MKDRCHNCGNTKFENKPVTLTLERINKLYKIQNVPAKVCTRCGQKYFTPDTYKSVYSLLNQKDRVRVKIEAEQLDFA